MKKELKSLFLEFFNEKYLNKYESLLLKYKINNKKKKLSQREAILLTYPNSYKNLAGLNKVFENKKINNIFHTVHILPMFISNSDGGFSASSYTKIDPEFGSWKEINSLQKKTNTMIDAIFNHTSNEHIWFKQYLKKNPSYQNYYISYNKKFDYSQIIRPRTSALFSKYGNEKVLTTFSEKQIDLNVKEVEVFFKFLELFHYYAKKKIKILRLDAIAYIIKKSHTTCANIPQTYKFSKLLIMSAKIINNNFEFVSEANFPDKENKKYITQANSDYIYQFSFPLLLTHAIHTNNFSYFSKWIKNFENRKNYNSFFFLSNHDGFAISAIKKELPTKIFLEFLNTLKNKKIKINYRINKGTKIPYEVNSTLYSLHKTLDIKNSYQKYLFSYNILMFMKGIPVIYYLDLINEENDIKTYDITKKNRDVNRKKYTVNEYLKKIETSNTFNELSKMISIRNKSSCFDINSKLSYQYKENLIIIKRKSKNKIIIGISNPCEKNIPIPKKYCKLKQIHPLNKKSNLLPFEYAWFLQELKN